MIVEKIKLRSFVVILVFALSSKISAAEFFEMGLLCQEDDRYRYIFLLDADKTLTFLKLPTVGEPSVEDFESDYWEQVSRNTIVISLNNGFKLISLTQSEVSGIFSGSTMNKKGWTSTIECNLLN